MTFYFIYTRSFSCAARVGAEARNSIGIILVAGMLIGTAFTLLVLPSVYIVLATDRNQTESPSKC
jgi:multidrug efflux pump subunit AcrB